MLVQSQRRTPAPRPPAPTCGERDGGWTVVAFLSSLFPGLGWQENPLALWDWMGMPATVRVMGLVTGRLPPGPTYTRAMRLHFNTLCQIPSDSYSIKKRGQSHHNEIHILRDKIVLRNKEKTWGVPAQLWRESSWTMKRVAENDAFFALKTRGWEPLDNCVKVGRTATMSACR